MSTEQPDQLQKQKRTSIFSGKLRVVAIILGLIFFVACLFYWIKGINSDQVNKVMGAIFTVLTMVCAFLSIPFLNRSEDSQVIAPAQIPPIQINNAVNVMQFNTQQPSAAAIPITSIVASNDSQDQATASNTGSQAMQQSSEFAPILNPSSSPVPHQSAQKNEPFSIDKNDLLDRLSSISSGLFSKVVFCMDPPTGTVSPATVYQTDRAVELLNWAVHPDGPGLEKLYDCYERAVGKKTHSGHSYDSPALHQIEQATKTSEISAELTSKQPNELTPAQSSQEQQPFVNVAGPHYRLLENTSSRELIAIAHGHIQEALLMVEAASKPFANKGNILPIHFKDAVKLLNTTTEHLRSLLKLLPMILSLQQEQALTRVFASYWEIRAEIYHAIEDADKLISYLQKEDHISRQEVTQRASRLVDILGKLILIFEDNGIST